MTGSTPIEERLRHALAAQASTTQTDPTAWDIIQDQTGQPPRARAPQARRSTRLVLAPLVGASMVALVVGALLVRGGSSRLGLSAGPDGIFLVPEGLDPRFRLVHATSEEGLGALQAGPATRVFGRRAPDGAALTAAAIVRAPAGDVLDGTEPEGALAVVGEVLTVHRDGYGRRILVWADGASGLDVALIIYGLGNHELTSLVESLWAGVLSAVPRLPAGFVTVFDGRLPPGPFPFTGLTWESEAGDRLSLNVARVPGLTLDGPAWELPGGRAVAVRGTTGIFADRAESVLTWIEPTGVVVLMSSPTLGEQELVAIARLLTPLSQADWQLLASTAQDRGPVPPPPSQLVPVPGQPSSPAQADSFLVVRPVLVRSNPPCPAGAVAQASAGQAVVCYEVGPAWMDAGDVARATARRDAATGTWLVETTLTAQGTARFRALAQAVGAGGQIAIVVDGKVVAAPVLASVAVPSTTVIAGLDEQTARSLAGRLNP